mmetsp:Transcript_89729/g.258666  ORF Transcript_89729/g.258666 Transcript_89729/m.258666 type:complete len:225 (+) Transcript_89729:1069-1743(+)
MRSSPGSMLMPSRCTRNGSSAWISSGSVQTRSTRARGHGSMLQGSALDNSDAPGHGTPPPVGCCLMERRSTVSPPPHRLLQLWTIHHSVSSQSRLSSTCRMPTCATKSVGTVHRREPPHQQMLYVSSSSMTACQSWSELLVSCGGPERQSKVSLRAAPTAPPASDDGAVVAATDVDAGNVGTAVGPGAEKSVLQEYGCGTMRNLSVNFKPMPSTGKCVVMPGLA